MPDEYLKLVSQYGPWAVACVLIAWLLIREVERARKDKQADFDRMLEAFLAQTAANITTQATLGDMTKLLANLPDQLRRAVRDGGRKN